jgi:hypothetical protein
VNEMTQAKHTPGPWVEPCNFGLSRFEVQGNGKQIAVVNTIEDARLISAAPELLTALRLVMECAGDIFSAPSGLLEMALDDGDEETHNQANAFLVARAAIAKATGAA